MADVRFIRNQIRRILLEAEGEVRRGSVGRGNLKVFVKNAKALAQQNPQELMKKLGNPSASGETADEKVSSLLQGALSGLESAGLGDMYRGVYLQRQGKNQSRVVRIVPGEISERDAVLYATHILTAAVKTGALSGLDKDVVPSIDGGEAVIKFEEPK